MAKNKKNRSIDNEACTLEKYGLKGKVWQVKQSCYNTVLKQKGVIVCKYNTYKFKRNSLYTFSENGTVSEKAYYNHSDGIYYDKYDAEGKPIEIMRYDNDGNLLSMLRREYNNWGLLHKQKEFDADNNLKSTTVWEYDENGFYSDFYTLMPDGSKSIRHTFINNEDGKPIEQTIYTKEGEVEKKILHKYDEHGSTIETKHLDANGIVQKVDTNTIQYDEAGNITLYNNRRWRHDKRQETRRYEYDSRGNWIKRVELYKDIPTEIMVREINYFDDAKEKFTLSIIPLQHFFILEGKGEINLQNLKDDDDDRYDSTRNENLTDVPLTEQQWQWIEDGSKSGEFNARRYYICRFNEFPTESYIGYDNVEATALRKRLKEEMEATELFFKGTDFPYDRDHFHSHVFAFPGKPYIVHITEVLTEDKNEFDCSEYVERNGSDYTTFNVGMLNFYFPPNASGKRDRSFENELLYHVEVCALEPVPDTPEISMVQVSSGNFHLHSHPVNDNFEIKDLDLNYGSGFQKFHTELMKRFESETQGLVLFHGEPGTGKTFYIRHLLRSMATKSKKVIYMPPNMVDHLVDPGFMTFLTRTINEFSARKIFCVLLIEDAEPLLASRQSDTRIQGVTNLLNMTDGLLNDMLRLQIICTFNVELKKIDKALLRPGRLVARKEFKQLSVLDANLLTQRLGIKHHFKTPATLGEIYALRKNKNTLVHDVDPDKDASTFIDDLI